MTGRVPGRGRGEMPISKKEMKMAGVKLSAER